MGGDTDQCHPDLVHDNHSVRQPATPDEGYHLNADLADHAIDFIKDAHVNAPDKPFFLWYATGAGHAPHQVEPEWVERYAGAFDMGWDEYRRIVFERQLAMGLLPPGTELSDRDPDVRAVGLAVADDAKRMYTRQMEVYAGFLTQTDHHIGRVLDFIDDARRARQHHRRRRCPTTGPAPRAASTAPATRACSSTCAPETLEDNLEVIDEWGERGHVQPLLVGLDVGRRHAVPALEARDLPGRHHRPVHRVVARRHRRPGARCATQYAHAIDIVPDPARRHRHRGRPTHIRGVAQSPMHGMSLAPTFADPDAPDPHTTQYFEMFGHRSIYHEGWKAVCPYPGPSLAEGVERGHPFGTLLTEAILDQLDAEDWELYDLNADPSECHDLAADAAREAGRDEGALVDRGRALRRAPDRHRRPRPGCWPAGPSVGGTREGGRAVPRRVARAVRRVAPRLQPAPHHHRPRDDPRSAGPRACCCTHGNRHGGYAFYVVDGHLHYVHNYLGLDSLHGVVDRRRCRRATELRMEFAPTGGPDSAAGKGPPGGGPAVPTARVVGIGELPYTVPNLFATAGISCGYAAFDTVDPSAYGAPFTFTGTIHKVVLDITGDLMLDAAAEIPP